MTGRRFSVTTSNGEVRGANPATPTPPLFGWSPLNDASGDFGADIRGGRNRANIPHYPTRGLSPNRAVRFNQLVFGNVIPLPVISEARRE